MSLETRIAVEENICGDFDAFSNLLGKLNPQLKERFSPKSTNFEIGKISSIAPLPHPLTHSLNALELQEAHEEYDEGLNSYRNPLTGELTFATRIVKYDPLKRSRAVWARAATDLLVDNKIVSPTDQELEDTYGYLLSKGWGQEAHDRVTVSQKGIDRSIILDGMRLGSFENGDFGPFITRLIPSMFALAIEELAKAGSLEEFNIRLCSQQFEIDSKDASFNFIKKTLQILGAIHKVRGDWQELFEAFSINDYDEVRQRFTEIFFGWDFVLDFVQEIKQVMALDVYNLEEKRKEAMARLPKPNYPSKIQSSWN